MHAFDELVQHCARFSLDALEQARQKVVEASQASSATPTVKALQMVRLQRVISAVGMFSMFDAVLQDALQSPDGFRTAGELLDKHGETPLNERFSDFQLAINVLKHGRGRSYDALVQKAGALLFRLKRPDEDLFNEGDVSEVSTLVEVDDAFVQRCADVIREVSSALRSAGHGI